MKKKSISFLVTLIISTILTSPILVSAANTLEQYGGGTNKTGAENVAAFNSAVQNGVKLFYFGSGTYKFDSPLSIPSSSVFSGVTKGAFDGGTVLKRDYTGATGEAFIIMSDKSRIEHLTIDGDTANCGAGIGVKINNGKHQSIANSIVTNFEEACLEFAGGAGTYFCGVDSLFYTAGQLGVVGAIKFGYDVTANTRTFLGCNSGGCTLFDFGGADDTYVFGGYTNGLIFQNISNKVMLSSMRIGSAAGTVTIKGGNHTIQGLVFAPPVIFGDNSIDCNMSNCIVSSENITDNGDGNSISYRGYRNYGIAWTTDGTQPSIGSGSLTARYSISGKVVTVFFDINLAADTNVGTGKWYLSLPVPEYQYGTRQFSGSWISNSVGYGAVGICEVIPEQQKIRLTYSDTNGRIRYADNTKPFTWGAGATIRGSFSYQKR